MHPFTKNKIPFATLIQELDNRVLLGDLERQEHPDYPGDLVLYNYTRQCTFNKAWDDYTISSRGLVVSLKESRVVAWAMPKFFNFGEGWDENRVVANGPFTVYEKYDGSCGIAFFYDEKWHITTRGSFSSEQAQTATRWIRDYSKGCLKPMNTTSTYVFEIIYPENRIVVNYPFQGLVFLCSYTERGIYQSPCVDNSIEEVEFTSWKPVLRGFFQESVSMKVADPMVHSLNELFDKAKTMGIESEGFVLHFHNGEKLKIKGEEYCRVHKLVSRITPIGIWEVMYDGQRSFAEYLSDIPEEFHADANRIFKILSDKSDVILQKHTEWYNANKHLTRKEYCVLAVMKQRLQPKEGLISGILIAMYIGKFNNIPKMILDLIRPKANILEGYVPSNIFTRFEAEE